MTEGKRRDSGFLNDTHTEGAEKYFIVVKISSRVAAECIFKCDFLFYEIWSGRITTERVNKIARVEVRVCSAVFTMLYGDLGLQRVHILHPSAANGFQSLFHIYVLDT